MYFSPRGSVWSFKCRILLRFSLGLAARSFWSHLEKFPRSVSGKILGQHFGSGRFWDEKWSRKKCFVEE